ncbi:hypothetical protein FHG87_003475, partial [Trinorchestia longiramus]
MADNDPNTRRASTGATYSSACNTRPYSHVISSSDSSAYRHFQTHPDDSVFHSSLGPHAPRHVSSPRSPLHSASPHGSPHRSPHRVADSSSNFFSERRLSQLFDVDSWIEEDLINGLESEDHGREPPPEPAPRSSYCPPSPPTSMYSTIGRQLNPYQNHTLNYPTLFVNPDLYPELSPSDGSEPRYSGDFQSDLARLSTVSGASSHFSAPAFPGNDKSHDASKDDSSGDAQQSQASPKRKPPTPKASTSSADGALESSRPSFSDGREGLERRLSGVASLPSLLSELGQQLENTDDDGCWPADGSDANGKVDWQNRCLELEMSLQKFRDHAGEIRNMLHDKVS